MGFTKLNGTDGFGGMGNHFHGAACKDASRCFVSKPDDRGEQA